MMKFNLGIDVSAISVLPDLFAFFYWNVSIDPLHLDEARNGEQYDIHQKRFKVKISKIKKSSHQYIAGGLNKVKVLFFFLNKQQLSFILKG